MNTTQKAKHTSKIRISRVAIILLLAILLGGGGYLYLRLSTPTADSTTETPLQTSKATTGDLVLFASGTGTVSPAAESSFGFNTSGQVSEIKVNVGDAVEAGQVLAQLDDTQAKIELAQAQEAMDKLTSAAAIATVKGSLAEALTDYDSTKKTLQYLISPQVLYWEENIAEREKLLAAAQAAAETDTSETAKQKVAQIEASLKYAQNSLVYYQQDYNDTYVKTNFTQYHDVFYLSRGLVTEPIKVEDENGKEINLVYAPTEGEIGMARAAYNLAKAQIAELQTYLDVLNGAEIPEDATGENLATYIETKHALETAQYNLNATKLIAPISGTITTLDINVGDLVSSGSAVVTVSNIDQPYTLDAYLDADNWGQIENGYEVEVTFDILPDQTFKGSVTNIYPTLDTSSASSTLVHFTAQLDETIPYELPSGAALSIEVIGGRAENTVLIPVEALHEFGDEQYAVFVMENGQPRLHIVEVGLKNLTKAEIISGLNAGDTVTTGVVKTR
ncbi:MAG: efflux RND transporter periplasmic adaptor subunit [Anaerolineales bacterium]|nr:efflux RND transporter periplasmic adaptor subunit [Anaerolineales bacterium]